MKINKAGLDLIKEFEGCKLVAYPDEVGVWTIGYGITNSDEEITGVHIRKGLRITRKTAEEWLEKSLDKKYGPKVMKYDKKYNWNENEYAALVSFCYNIGNIDTLTAYGTRSKAVIANKMLLYNKAGKRGVLNGLTKRRKAERALFLKPVNAIYGTVATTKGGLNLRKTGSTKAAVLKTMPKGAKVQIISKGAKWYKVRYNGTTGWCMGKYIK